MVSHDSSGLVTRSNRNIAVYPDYKALHNVHHRRMCRCQFSFDYEYSLWFREGAQRSEWMVRQSLGMSRGAPYDDSPICSFPNLATDMLSSVSVPSLHRVNVSISPSSFFSSQTKIVAVTCTATPESTPPNLHIAKRIRRSGRRSCEAAEPETACRRQPRPGRGGAGPDRPEGPGPRCSGAS